MLLVVLAILCFQRVYWTDCECILLFLDICNNCIWYFCVSLYLQQFYLKSLCVFVFATIVFGNDTGSLPALAFDCRAAASSVDGTPGKKINVSASSSSIQDLKSREAKYRWKNYRKISCTKSTGKQRQHPRSFKSREAKYRWQKLHKI